MMPVNDLTDRFFDSCGLHGLNKLHLDKTAPRRRIVWLTLILGSLAYLGYTVYVELCAYYTYPTTTAIEVDQHEVMSFPAITLCNLSPYNKSKQPINDSRHFNLSLSLSATWHWAASSINWSDVEYQDDIFQTPVGISDLFNLGMDMNLSVPNCTFDKRKNKCFQNLQQIITQVGPCFTFNNDGHIKTKETGTNSNLMLRINIDQANYFTSFSDGSGIKVIVHEPGAAPDVYNDGFVLPPGAFGYAGINKKVYRRRPAPYNRHNPCIDTESSNFRNPNKHSNYSLSSCFRECRHYHARAMTGCIIPAFNADPPYCPLSRYSEFIKAMPQNHGDSIFTPTLPSLTLKDVAIQIFIFLPDRAKETAIHDESIANKCKRRCVVPCKRVEYDVKITYGEYPSQFTADLVKAYVNPTYSLSYLRSNYLLLNVFYEKLETTYWNQIPRYQTVGDVLANLGGQLGLFLGASLLTLVEILEFCGQIILYKSCKNKTFEVKVKANDEPEVKKI